MTEKDDYILKSPEAEEEWRSYHSIRRKVLFENRGIFGVYDENHPDEFRSGHHSMVLLHHGEPIGVIRIDIEGTVAIFRRVAVRDDMQRRGHGKVLLALAERFARQRRVEVIRSSVNPDAVGFYQRSGFTLDQAGTDDLAAVPMSKVPA